MSHKEGEVADQSDWQCLSVIHGEQCTQAAIVHMLLSDGPVLDPNGIYALICTTACYEHADMMSRNRPIYGVHFFEEICRIPESRWHNFPDKTSNCRIPDDQFTIDALAESIPELTSI